MEGDRDAESLAWFIEPPAQVRCVTPECFPYLSPKRVETGEHELTGVDEESVNCDSEYGHET